MGDITRLPDLIQQLIQLLTQLKGVIWPLLHPEEILVQDGLGLVLKLWFDFVLSTKDLDHGGPFTHNAVIQSFEPTVQAVADGLLILATMWASYRIMWSHGIRTQFTARVLLPRLLMGAVLINFSMPMFQAVVDARNTLSSVVTQFQTIADFQTYWQTFTVNPQDTVWQVVTTVALVLGYDVLAIAYVVRYTILILLAISAPLAGLLFVLPETIHIAKLWRKLFVTNLFMQPVQLFVIAVGFALENTGTFPLRHAFALAALLVVFKVPGAMGSAEAVAHKLESLLHHSAMTIERAVVHAR